MYCDVFAGLAYFYFKTLVSAWAAKGVLNAVRFFVAGYRIHFHFLCPPLGELQPQANGHAANGHQAGGYVANGHVPNGQGAPDEEEPSIVVEGQDK